MLKWAQFCVAWTDIKLQMLPLLLVNDTHGRITWGLTVTELWPILMAALLESQCCATRTDRPDIVKQITDTGGLTKYLSTIHNSAVTVLCDVTWILFSHCIWKFCMIFVMLPFQPLIKLGEANVDYIQEVLQHGHSNKPVRPSGYPAHCKQIILYPAAAAAMQKIFKVTMHWKGS